MTPNMTTTRPQDAMHGWFSRGEAWLDSKGKGAWIAALVLGFIVFWPVGLVLLAYLIWSRRLFNTSCEMRRAPPLGQPVSRSSGNSAFDAYKADTLHRLEQEQEAFEAFLQRLRAAKDKAEFDQFLEYRAQTPKPRPDTDAA